MQLSPKIKNISQGKRVKKEKEKSSSVTLGNQEAAISRCAWVHIRAQEGEGRDGKKKCIESLTLTFK